MSGMIARAQYALRGSTLIAGLLMLLMSGGCSGTSGTAEESPRGTQARTLPDTGSASVREPEFPPGKFTVQLGAYQSEDAARKVASVAGSRFTRQIYTVYDAVDRLHKVMLGMFDTKDQARQFRDTIVRQYGDDYRDAWVSELKR